MNKEKVERAAEALFANEDFFLFTGGTGRDGLSLAGQRAVVEVLEELISVLFPTCFLSHGSGEGQGLLQRARSVFEGAVVVLRDQVRRAFEYECQRTECDPECEKCGEKADEAMAQLLGALPGLLAILHQDVQAAYEGDPAAKSTLEAVISYPGVYAVVVHRLAHVLHQAGVPLIPRIMTEHAHSRTGIDIHPGAQIGAGFFIDHGTGVVIGETCVIGQHVKLYQGVTLGALSFEKDEQGRLVKGVKRHPDVEDDVVVYAGATILGGRTRIGKGAVIGGNVWLTHSVPPRAKVYNTQPNPLIKESNGAWKTVDGPWNNVGDGI